MDRRGKKLLILAFLVILLFVGFSVYLIFFKKERSLNEITPTNRELVPFGDRTREINQLPSTDDLSLDEQISVQETDNLATPISSRERLRKITSFPVSGYTSFLAKEIIKETVVDEKTGKETQVSKPLSIHTIRYNDQRNGHVFDGIITDETIVNKKITKTNFPISYETVFNSDGTVGFVRYERNRLVETVKMSLPNKKVSTNPPQVCITPITLDLKVGDRNNQVKILQDYLNYTFKQSLQLDGVFGKLTRDSVQTIQGLLSLEKTGVVDQPTREAIFNECKNIAQEILSSDELQEITGSLVSGNLQHLVKNRSTNQWLSLERSQGKTTGLLQSFSGTQALPVFSSSFNEWFPQFVNKDLITMNTYASGSIDGYLYGINTTTKKFTKLLGPLPGLTTNTSPDGVWTIATFTRNNQFITRLINLQNGSVEPVSFVVIPEKCSWYSVVEFYCGVPNNFPPGLYPDDWYKGIITFSDTLWKYNISTKERVQITTLPENTDVFRIESYPELGYLFFMNKNNYELWSYRVGGED